MRRALGPSCSSSLSILAETFEAYRRLIDAGKVRAIGASNFRATRLREAAELSAASGLPRFQSLQPLYNLMERAGFENELAAVSLGLQIGVIPYYSLASGFLTGKYRSAADLTGKPRGNRVEQYLTERGSRVLKALDEVSERYETKPASVALAWLMRQPAVTAPIVSATSIEQLRDIVDASELTLDSGDLEDITVASAI